MRGEEVKNILKKNGFVIKEVAAVMGETPQNLNSMLNAEDIKTGVLERIAKATNRSLYFFLEDSQGLGVCEPQAEYRRANKGIPLLMVGEVDVLAKENQNVLFKNSERYFVPEFEKYGIEFVIRAGDNSMIPKYLSGDILACKNIKDINFFQWGKTYVISTSQGILIRRVFEHIDVDKLLLVSENKEKYPSFSILKADILSLSLVLGLIRVE